MNSNPKTRIDAWDAPLAEEQRWQVYDKSKTAAWHAVTAWAVAEFGLGGAPSRQAYYDFLSRMRKSEAARRMEQMAMARAEVGDIAKAAAMDEALIQAYKALAADAALSGDAKTAVQLTCMAMDITASQTEKAKLRVRQDALKLEQQKFQRVTCELFLKWRGDDRARNIADDPKLGNAEKTEALGKLLFGDLWK